MRRRRVEIGLLRSIGATPGQVRRLVIVETLVVAVVAAAAGAGLAWPAGRVLLDAIRDAVMVSPTVAPTYQWAGIPISAALVIAVSVIAAALAARRPTGGAPRLALTEEATPAGRLRRWRTVPGWALLGAAVASGVVTVTVMADLDDPYAPMQSSGSASVAAGVGLALLAPALLARVARSARGPLARAGAPGELASATTARRSLLMSGILGPIVVLVSVGVGTLALVGIDARTLVLPPEMTQEDADLITTLNAVVVGMIAAFAAIMVVNSLLAVIGERAAEFARLRLVGATTGQLRRTVLVETLLVSVLGVALGLVGALTTIVPFGWARGEGIVPDAQLWMAPAMAAFGIVLAVLAGQVACGRALRDGTRALQI